MTSENVQPGWLVMLDDKWAYVPAIKSANGQLEKIMIRRALPDGTWNTHWLKAATWHKRFVRLVAVANKCIQCGELPTHCQSTGGMLIYTCTHCGWQWELA